jgi:hypothetical protein
MSFLDALVASICKSFGFGEKDNTRVLKESKVMAPTMCKIRTNYLTRSLVDNYLTFNGVTLLFARVEPFLSFFGR